MMEQTVDLKNACRGRGRSWFIFTRMETESTVVLMPKDLCAKRIPKKKNKMARIRKKFHLEAFFFKTAACDE
jgi:hypothetical protein